MSYVTISSQEPKSEEVMLTATDVAREIAASRRAEAHEAALGTAVRLARRKKRLNKRIQRIDEQLAGR